MLDFIRKKVFYFLVMRSFKKHEKQIIFDCPIYGEHGSDIIAKYGIANISIINERTIKSPTYSRSSGTRLQASQNRQTREIIRTLSSSLIWKWNR